MTVKEFWQKHLGDFREEDRKRIQSLPDKRVAVDVSAWVHMYDGIHVVKYARTSYPRYPHPLILSSFAAKNRALKALGLHPVYVFDGISPNMKKRTNRAREQKSVAARNQYRALVDGIMGESGRVATEEERKAILQLRRDIARPIREEYASLAQWMSDNGIEYVRAPFEADAEIKQIILEGRASGAITEDGDLVVFGVPHVLSQTKIDTREPQNSTCQYFDLKELKDGAYNSPIAAGRRSEFLAEISCFSGNDYINNLPNVGPSAIFGSHKTKRNQTALIDSFIEETAITKSKTERQWLEEYEAVHNKTKSDDREPSAEDWSVDRFIQVRNLILHYPVFKLCKDSGAVHLEPLTPLPSGVRHCDWGSYIGFEKHPSEYFEGRDLKQYYTMDVDAATDLPRSELLGPRYTAHDNPKVDTNELLPVFARIAFDRDPVDVQPTAALKSYLLARGVTVPEKTTPAKIRELALSACELGPRKPVMHPSLVPKPAKWVGFEPLDDLEIGDQYDDWNGDYVSKIRSLKTVDDDYIDHHFGTEHAQYERESAFVLLDGGNIGLSTIMARNVKSELKPGENLIAFKFKCLSSERAIIHTVYMVFENEGSREYVQSPASYCSCENGAFFCSHMLCFFYVMRGIQVGWRDKTQQEIEKLMPLDRRVVQNKPCLIENVLARDHIRRQEAQSKRQAAKRQRR